MRTKTYRGDGGDIIQAGKPREGDQGAASVQDGIAESSELRASACLPRLYLAQVAPAVVHRRTEVAQ